MIGLLVANQDVCVNPQQRITELIAHVFVSNQLVQPAKETCASSCELLLLDGRLCRDIPDYVQQVLNDHRVIRLQR